VIARNPTDALRDSPGMRVLAPPSVLLVFVLASCGQLTNGSSATPAQDDLVFAVGEAATNSVEHAYRPARAGDTVELTFWTRTAGGVRRGR
jgi:anti-sigma regulatory factor (Ser/Thr protein kinase)